jgi:putative transposase
MCPIRKFKTRKVDNSPGDAHELTFTCHNGLPLLSKDRTCEWLADAINRYSRRDNIHVWAYVFMPNHVHLLVWPAQEEYKIEVYGKSIKQSVARKATIYLRKNKPEELNTFHAVGNQPGYRFWLDGGGYDRNMESGPVIINSVNYIHANPLRKGLVEYPSDWRWSSAADWEGVRKGPVKLDWSCFPK